MTTTMAAPTDEATESLASAIERMASSERLRKRQFTMLPLNGPTAPVTGVQGRGPGDSTTPAELEGLISSIAIVGLLQPLLVEQLGSRHILVAGERRLRALRYGHVHQPDNEHFQTAPAIVCPGPLSEEERRCWQLVENLAREDLGVGELGAALLFERSAVLAGALQSHGVEVPDAVMAVEDPTNRWLLLDKHRVSAGAHSVGAPWEEVLKRIGVQLNVDKAKQVVRAFKALPAEVSSQMDAEGVALATRLDFLKLGKGRDNAASEIWAAVRERGTPKLLGSAVRAALADPNLSGEQAVEVAQQLHEAANASRSAALRGGSDAADGEVEEADPEIVGAAVTALTRLLAELRGGKKIGGYAGGTLLLHARELLTLAGGQPS
ncbi:MULTISPECIES: ParB/RepB/Spo0J family partition protein [Mycobacterium]|uniref:ParB/RepB/Spo0J family partition protein n=1 Tax=Mycobacterium paragordonae TaxID=1389713 RepID=A0AAJ1SAH7_9MYCO|nr:ParB/RepB/Spo0J family partition protein [Mycobacterium paragordonae]MDP7739645.1 ParB/RepB/Spo0J family partition protein [Mycobacterium paragordonae]